MMNKNVFVKPNGQSRACASYAVPLHKPEMERWSMPRQQQVTPIERDFVRRLTSGWLAVSNGQAFNWEYGRRIWGVGSIYPGSYLDARTLSFPLPR